MSEFKPTSKDIQFARDIVNIIMDGGVWAWKDMGLRYQFFHEVKVMQLLNPELLSDPRVAEAHHKTVVTWEYIEWKVLPER